MLKLIALLRPIGLGSWRLVTSCQSLQCSYKVINLMCISIGARCAVGDEAVENNCPIAVTDVDVELLDMNVDIRLTSGAAK